MAPVSHSFFLSHHHHPSLGGTGWDTATFPHQPVVVFENRLHLSSLECCPQKPTPGHTLWTVMTQGPAAPPACPPQDSPGARRSSITTVSAHLALWLQTLTGRDVQGSVAPCRRGMCVTPSHSALTQAPQFSMPTGTWVVPPS